MESEIATIDLNELVTYSVTEAGIEALKAEYLPLRVHDFNDEQGYALCKDAKKEIVSLRTSVEKRRKELKKDSLEFGRLVDSEAKKLTAKIEEIEDHLKAQLEVVDGEKRRREEEAAREAQERINARIAALQEVGAKFDYNAVAVMSEDDYDHFLSMETVRHNAELRKQAEEAERLAKLEAERAEAERKQREQEAEIQRLKDELLAKQRAELAEKEQAARDAERARIQAELQAQQEREAREQAEREAREAEERRRAEEDAAKAQAEEEARQAIANEREFEAIKRLFPTLESAWVEIARLRKEVAALEAF